MHLPFRKKVKIKEYNKFIIVNGVVTKCKFFARDEEDAESYIQKVRDKNAENESSNS